MKPFFVVNPCSANGQTGKRWAELSARLSRGLGEFGHAFTQAPMEASLLTRRALQEGYDRIVAVGGDGTVNEVVNGFFDQGRPINPEAALGLVCRGTGGDFRRTFGWDLDVDAAIARIGSAPTQPFDVGQVEFSDPSGARCVRYFANVASLGVSGQVAANVNAGSKAFGGKLSFMVGSVKALLGFRDQKVRFTADQLPPEEASITTIAVANGGYFGGGMKVAPAADTADGLFDVTLWSGFGLSDFALKSKSLYDGTHVQLAGTRTLRCRRFEVESEETVLLDVDGEQPGRLPCVMTVLPSAIRRCA